MCPTRTSPRGDRRAPEEPVDGGCGCCDHEVLPRRYSPTTTSPRNKHLTRQARHPAGPVPVTGQHQPLMQYTAIVCKERVTALILHRARPPRGAAKEKAHTLPTERGTGFLHQVPNRAGSVGQGGWEGRRGTSGQAPARRETDVGFLQKGQIHLKIPPKTASDTKT